MAKVRYKRTVTITIQFGEKDDLETLCSIFEEVIGCVPADITLDEIEDAFMNVLAAEREWELGGDEDANSE